MKAKKIVLLSICLITYICCIHVSYVNAAEQYVCPATFSIGDYGKAKVFVVCSVNKKSKSIQAIGWGNYSVSLKSGRTITLNSRSYSTNSTKTKITINCKFTGTNSNTHSSKTYNVADTITYSDISKYNNW